MKKIVRAQIEHETVTEIREAVFDLCLRRRPCSTFSICIHHNTMATLPIFVDSRHPRLCIKLGNVRNTNQGATTEAISHNLPYSAPEAYLPSQTYDSLAEIWSLGIVTLECLHLRLPEATHDTVTGRLWAKDVFHCAVNEGRDATTLGNSTNDPDIVLRGQLYGLVVGLMLRSKGIRRSATCCLAAGQSTVSTLCQPSRWHRR